MVVLKMSYDELQLPFELTGAKEEMRKIRSASLSCRTKSTKTGWQMRRWKQSFKDCKLEKKEEKVTHCKQLIAAWRRWWNRFSPWERIRQGLRSMPCVKNSSGDLRPPPSHANDRKKKKEEETVKLNKSKAEPVSSWCYPHQAESIKMRQRVVWSLIFLVYGVCLVSAEVQEEQASKEIERELSR